jgi:2-polyprenyl-6-methoxyphenol hydroxylase-like FAD-dependent oxidoreductase
MMRPVLHDVLAGAMEEAGVPVRFGTTVAALEQAEDGVDVIFNDGREAHYDLVVGADGAGSKLRTLLFGDGLEPDYTGQAVWRAMVPRPADVDCRQAYFGPRNKAGFNPVSQSEMYVYLVQNVTGDPRLAPERWPAVMRELLIDFGGYIGAVRDTITDPRRIVYRPVGSRLLPAPWYSGRALLIGDAAHTAAPHLASGAGIAIEDAIVLADLIGSGAPAAEVLAAFMTRRWERCRLVVENSHQLGEWEKTPGMAGADPVGLQASSFAALAQPI